MPDQASLSPTRKVLAGGIAGAGSVVLVWVLNSVLLKEHPLPPEVSSAITTVLSAIAGYFTSPSDKDLVGKKEGV